MALTHLVQKFKKKSFQSRNHRTNLQISFADRLPAARSMVVCLPEEKKYFDAFIGPLEKLTKIFPKAHITLVYHKNNLMPAAYHDKFTLIEWNEQNLNRFGIPRDELLQKIFDSPCDVAIDLSPGEHFVNMAIAQSSDAPIRVCLAHAERESLYNFILRPTPNQEPARIINSLLAYLNPGTTL